MESLNMTRSNDLLKNKRVLVIIVLFIILALLLFVFLLTGKSKPETVTKSIPTVIPYPSAALTGAARAVTEFTPEQQKVIEEQRKADETVGKRETEIRSNFPWFVKMPLRGDKYFVYFETNSRVFTGLLYPEAGDNTDQMKAEIRNKLKTVYNVPVDEFTFKWTTFE